MQAAHRSDLGRVHWDMGRVYTQRTVEQFWQMVRVGHEEECWSWLGGYKNGYGRLWWRDRSRRAHQVAFELHHGRPLTPGLFVLHHCDNPPCCNPAHLYEGTQADNNRDRDARKRTRGHATLSAVQVHAIRDAYASGQQVTQNDLARQFGVTQSSISRVLSRDSWAHLEDR